MRIPKSPDGDYLATRNEWASYSGGHIFDADGTGTVQITAVSYQCPYVDVCRNSQLIHATNLWTGVESERQLYVLGMPFGGGYPTGTGPWGSRDAGGYSLTGFAWQAEAGMGLNPTNFALEFAETGTGAVSHCLDFAGTNVPFVGSDSLQRGWAVSNALRLIRWDGANGFSHR